MRLCYLIPETSYAFLRELSPFLEAAGCEVRYRDPDEADVVLAAMLPQTADRAPALANVEAPLVLWHWDQFSFVDFERHPGWRALYELMPRAADLWSASYETARLLKASHGYDSFVVGSWANPADFRPPFASGDYVLYAAPRSAFHKRVEWVELACRRLGLPLVTTYQCDRTRQEYCEIVKGCRCYVMAAFEESNATIPALEAALCGKPVLASRLPACVEELGCVSGEGAAHYFDPWDFGDLLRQLPVAYESPHPAAALRERVERLFSLEVVARRIVRRLQFVMSGLG
ncbi:MAG TPA: hypothetical protein VMV10_12170 [Pirellulales bacterium]|nr:hypothetical protein [Pirellulales bacterium]